MKKILSVFLSAVMLFSISVGFNTTAKAENTIDTAYELAANGGSCSGKVSFNGSFPSDYYRINLYASGTLNLNISATDGIKVYLYRNDGKTEVYDRVFSRDGNFGRVQETLKLNLRGGIYYLRIQYDATDSSYQITTALTPCNESFPETDENNNDYVDTASPITYDTLYYGLIGLDESDFYSFYVSNKTDIKLNIDYYTTMDIIAVTLLDNYGKTISQRAAFSTNGHILEELVFTSLNPGSYYIKISGRADAVYTYGYGPYAFSISAFCEHDFASTRKDSTYFAKGYYKQTCQKCGYSYISEYIQKKKLSTPSQYLETTSKKLIVNLYPVNDASGYEIKYSTSKKFSPKKTKTIKVKGNKPNNGYRKTKKIKNLKSGKKYYVKVRAYKTKGNKKVYSSWSNKTTIKVK